MTVPAGSYVQPLVIVWAAHGFALQFDIAISHFEGGCVVVLQDDMDSREAAAKLGHVAFRLKPDEEAEPPQAFSRAGPSP